MRVAAFGGRKDSEMVQLTSIDPEFPLDTNPKETKELIEELNKLQKSALLERIPWFQRNMPDSYFIQIPAERRMKHLLSVVAVPDMDHIPEIASYEFFDPATESMLKRICIVSSGRDLIGKLESQVQKLPNDGRLSSLNLYTALPEAAKKYYDELMSGKFEEDRSKFFSNTGEALHPSLENMKKVSVDEFLALEQNSLETRLSPRRFFKIVDMYYQLKHLGTDEVLLDIESNWGAYPEKTLYTFALKNVIVKPTLTRICKYLESRGMLIERAHLDPVKGETQEVSFLRLLVSPADSDAPLGKEFADVKKEFKEFLPLVAKWYDDRIINYLSDETFGRRSPIDFEILVGLLDCVHLVKSRVPEDMYAFSRSNVFSVISRPQTFDIIELFKKKFYLKEDVDVEAESEKIKNNIMEYVETPMHQDVLFKLIEVVKATEKTNLYNPSRFGFGVKLNPAVAMNEKDSLRTETPYGMFYVNGRRFTGMQIRFREISRGGLRLVTPNSKDMYNIEATRQFNECYDLAFAQQQKNKDIPEGGSKAVCLVNMEDGKTQTKDHIVKKSLKAFVNSVLDIMVRDPDNNELIFFGPDEQVTVDHINWMVQRAEERNYIMPATFMSSKPDQGINHKEYGVTSEGVSVFFDVAVKALKLDQTDKGYFTVKITGGPDGDVAGNMLKILHREYGDKCRVVGIADGTGCVENPSGIAWSELLRLANSDLPLSEFSSEADSESEKYTLEKAAGVQKRNTMHNRVQADIFVPGGGRPSTVHEGNWKQFLNSDGEPISKLIVEGANLFFTNGARKALGKEGAVFIKDSSANKAGVGCSSFEILSCMMLDKEEFLGIKAELVPQVLDKLKVMARKEAGLLISEYKKNVTSDFKKTDYNLVDTSIEVSRALNRTIDSVRIYLETHDVDLKQFDALVKEYLPESLVKFGFEQGRFYERVPEVYHRNLLSTILAADLVYFEGLDFIRNVQESFSGDDLAELAIKYAREKSVVQGLISKFDANEDMTESEMKMIVALLKKGGPRSAIGF
eukprot:maker-scaffold_8-augustus-gene-13.60-mRNA-1 protein AED:0.03 eAED:0.05 QI:0/0/0/1/1/1/2/0/1023